MDILVDENRKNDLEKVKIDINLKTKTVKHHFSQILRHITLIFVGIITFFPFIWMISSALKTKDEIFSFPPKLIPSTFEWSNFAKVFSDSTFAVYIGNSVFVAVLDVALQVVTAAMIAYAFTQMRFKGRKVLFAVVMGTYMLPSAVTYVPCYILLSDFNLIDTLTGLIISDSINIFGIFLMRQAFLQVDKSLVEAARLDGASHFKILWKIIFPLTKPTFITLILLNFVTCYNDYMYPSLILKSPEKFLISSGLRQFFIEGGAYGINWPEIMAASTVTVLPLLILFIICQKWFMKGVAGDTSIEK